MNELHLFAGGGGGILGGMLCGHTCVCAVEIEPYCREILLQRQRDGILPKFPIWDDVRTFDGKPWRGKVDVVCGGFPCQDISSANPKAVGICGERSGLWREMARIVGEVAPEYVFAENSPMLESRGVERVLEDLNSLGYDTRRVKLGAENLGKTVRQRLWILGRRAGEPDNPRNVGCRDAEYEVRSDCFLRTSAFSGILRASPPAGVCGMGDGVPHRLDRLATVGNAQIPVVAALAFTVLKWSFDSPEIEKIDFAEAFREAA